MAMQQHNLFLNSLLPDARSLVLSHCQPGSLAAGTRLFESETRPRYLYFLTSGTASVVTTTPNGMGLEVGLIGREGFSGSLHLLGTGLVSTRCLMQADGHSLRMELTTFEKLFDASAEIRTRVLEYVQSQILTLSQLAGCNRFHTVDQRLARMLLMVLDRSDTNLLSLTQELLAELLGARRTTITGAAGLLQKQGIVAYSRGHLRVLDRSRLKLAACTCYPVVQQLYLRLYEQAIPLNEPWSAYLPTPKSPLIATLLNNLTSTQMEKAHALKVAFPLVTHLPLSPAMGVVAQA